MFSSVVLFLNKLFQCLAVNSYTFHFMHFKYTNFLQCVLMLQLSFNLQPTEILRQAVDEGCRSLQFQISPWTLGICSLITNNTIQSPTEAWQLLGDLLQGFLSVPKSFPASASSRVADAGETFTLQC